MWQENVDLVRGAFQVWYPNDSEAFARHLDPEFEYVVTYGPERGVYRGWKATVEAFDLWEEPFSDYRWKPEAYLDGGVNHVVVAFTEGGHGKASGVQIEQRRAFLCTLRQGKIFRITEYPSTPEALEAAGLSE